MTNDRTIAALVDALTNVLALARVKYGNLDEGANVVFAQAQAALDDVAALEAAKVQRQNFHPFTSYDY